MGQEGGEQGHKYPRRRFIKKGLAVLGGVLLGGAYLNTRKAPEVEIKELPADILTDEELTDAHIQVYASLDTQLLIRKSALELPLFKDAAEGKLNQVVIALADNLSWNATRKLPEDARLVWDSITESPEENYQSMLKWYKDKSASNEESEESKRKAQTEIDRMLSNPSEWIEGHKAISFAWGYHLRTNTISGYSWITGDKAKNFLKEHPELDNRIYIFLGVGGRLAPNPNQSFLNPEQVKKSASSQQAFVRGDSYRFESPSSGFALRHEIGHYPGNSEYQADAFALESIEEAWKKYKEGKDDSGYSFVFINPKGTTITQNTPANENPELIV